MGTQSRKPFAWSYSALNAFETCPRQWGLVNVKKKVPFVQNDAAKAGELHHKILSEALRYGPDRLGPSLEHMANHIKALRALPTQKIYVENKVAFDRDMKPLPNWFHSRTWFRAIFDYAAILVDGKKGIVVDWKTGKVKEDRTQLKVFAAALMFLHPELESARVGMAWTKTSTMPLESFAREEIMEWWENELLPRVAAMEAAYLGEMFEPKPSGLCGRWCPVKVNLCEFGG